METTPIRRRHTVLLRAAPKAASSSISEKTAKPARSDQNSKSSAKPSNSAAAAQTAAEHSDPSAITPPPVLPPHRRGKNRTLPVTVVAVMFRFEYRMPSSSLADNIQLVDWLMNKPTNQSVALFHKYCYHTSPMVSGTAIQQWLDDGGAPMPPVRPKTPIHAEGTVMSARNATPPAGFKWSIWVLCG